MAKNILQNSPAMNFISPQAPEIKPEPAVKVDADTFTGKKEKKRTARLQLVLQPETLQHLKEYVDANGYKSVNNFVEQLIKYTIGEE